MRGKGSKSDLSYGNRQTDKEKETTGCNLMMVTSWLGTTWYIKQNGDKCNNSVDDLLAC